MLVVRPGYRIGSRTIKRGSQVSKLIASLWRAQTFAYLAYHLSLLLFGFYPCEDLELVFISMTISSSSKTDFIWISCCVFDIGGFTCLSFIERSNSLLVVSSSHDGLWCLYAWSYRACCQLQNKPKLIENGVRMQKLLQFSYCCFCQAG